MDYKTRQNDLQRMKKEASLRTEIYAKKAKH